MTFTAHAAAEFKINLKHPGVPCNLTKKVQKSANMTDENFSKLESFYAYVSWFPKSNFTMEGSQEGLARTGRVMSKEERQGFCVGSVDERLRPIKERMILFLSEEYEAENGSFEDDKLQYGDPAPSRVLSLTDVNFEKIVDDCFKMMDLTVLEQRKLVLTSLLPDATYYGVDMLRDHRKKIDPTIDISPQHVCTTAVMRLIRSGLGYEQYCKIRERVIAENLEVTHGIPIVELTHLIAKEASVEERALLTPDTCNGM